MDKLKTLLRHSPALQALMLLCGWNCLIRLVAAVGYFILPSRAAPLDFIAPALQSNFLLWSFANFDGEHYLSIAKFGYQIRSGFPQYAFFPLLPLLIKIVSSIVRDYYVAGLIVTQTGLWIALTYIYKWCRQLNLPDLRLPLLLTPSIIFLTSVYTEPVFLALAAMVMYYSERKSWGRAVILTALATATRVNGIFLVAFLLVKMIKAKRSRVSIITSSLLALSGLGGYMVFLSYKTGDTLAWFHAQAAWGKAVATSPLTTLTNYLRAISVDFQPDLIHLVVIIEVITTAVALSLFLILLKRNKLDIAYWIYLAGNLALPLATGSLGSMPRFYLTLFPLLIVVPSLSRPGRTLYYGYSLVAAVIGIILFTRGYWYG